MHYLFMRGPELARRRGDINSFIEKIKQTILNITEVGGICDGIMELNMK